MNPHDRTARRDAEAQANREGSEPSAGSDGSDLSVKAISRVYGFALSRLGSSNNVQRFVARLAITLLNRLSERVREMDVVVLLWGRRLVMPMSHRLPIFVAENPLYDRLLGRLAEFLRYHRGALGLIDVGANIGDTIIATLPKPKDVFLAVEANPRFVPYLLKNVSFLSQFALATVYCGAAEGECQVSIHESCGTAVITEGGGAKSVRRRTVDQVLKDYPELSGFNFLKVDTDGHDFEVLKGAMGFIRRVRPAILFECDAFTNARYVEDVWETIRLLHEAGYERAIVYDNFGYLFTVIDLSNPTSFATALAYQLVSHFYYFDVVVISGGDFDRFLDSELDFFKGLGNERRPVEAIGMALDQVRITHLR
jgi:FkbM family methyltransferase